jgi:hypothetical protein
MSDVVSQTDGLLDLMEILMTGFSSIEPHMKIINLSSTTMKISNNVDVDVWTLVSKKRYC